MSQSDSLVSVNGRPFYMHGANYPWMVKNGKSNYGLDFGVNLWGTHEGVSSNLEAVESDFTEMQRLGFTTVRWFMFTDGRSGIVFDEAHSPVGLSPKVFDDIDAVIQIADRHSIKLIFVLLDYLFAIRTPKHSAHTVDQSFLLRSSTHRTQLIENVFVPLFDRYAETDGILAWEVMNEPDWVVRELDPGRDTPDPIPMQEFQRFVRSVADEVHARTSSLVTVGGGRTKFVHVWDDDAFGLDFVQVHTYNDFLRRKHDDILFGQAYASLKLTRPLLIGEYSTNATQAFGGAADGSIPVEEYLKFAKGGGYAGALYWSFLGVDDCGTENRLALLNWSSRPEVT